MIQKVEGAFGSAWHGAGSLPMYVGGSIHNFDGDEWDFPAPGSGLTEFGTMLAFIPVPNLIGESGGVKTYEADGGFLRFWNNLGAEVETFEGKFTYRTQPNPDGSSIIPEHVIQIDFSTPDGKVIGMTPRTQGPRHGFGWVDFRLVRADDSTTPRELKLAVREAI